MNAPLVLSVGFSGIAAAAIMASQGRSPQVLCIEWDPENVSFAGPWVQCARELSVPIDRLEAIWGPFVRGPERALHLGGRSKALLARIRGVAKPSPLYFPVLSVQEQLARQIALIRKSGGDVLSDVNFEEAEFNDGHISAVLTDVGRMHTGGVCWADAPPTVVRRWLRGPFEDASEFRALKCAHEVRVSGVVDQGATSLLAQFNGVDFSKSGWSHPGYWPGQSRWQGYLTRHEVLNARHPWLLCSDEDLAAKVLAQSGPDISWAEQPFVVDVSSHAIPANGPDYAALRSRYLNRVNSMGIRLVGSRGLFKAMRFGEEMRWLLQSAST